MPIGIALGIGAALGIGKSLFGRKPPRQGASSGYHRDAKSWSEQDRQHYLDTYRPLETQFTDRLRGGPEFDRYADQYSADVAGAFANSQAQQGRALAARGVSPDSGRSVAAGRELGLSQAAATVGARNLGIRQAQADHDNRMQFALNYGAGQQGAATQHLSLAGQQGGQAYRNRLYGYGLDQQRRQDNWKGVGQIAGFVLNGAGVGAG